MERPIDRNCRCLGITLIVMAFVCIQCAKAEARTKKQLNSREKAILVEFLSSLELEKNKIELDHNRDQITDMYVYPLINNSPDLQSSYITLKEAVAGKQVLLKENSAITNPNPTNPPGNYNIVAAMMGGSRSGGYGSSSRYGSRYGSGGSRYSSGGSGYGSGGSAYGSGIFSQRGGMLGGGFQNRGIGMGGIYGGSGYGSGSGYRPGGGGYRPGGGSQGYRPGYRVHNNSEQNKLYNEIVAMDTPSLDLVAQADVPQFDEVEISALCFEKWRLIAQSRLMGKPQFFSYVGMASPYIRKQLVMFPNQTNIHINVEHELRRLGVQSNTKAMSDAFKHQEIKQTIEYYLNRSKEITANNKNISGMVITTGSNILSADAYCSPQLFAKMAEQLMQSAALAICLPQRPIRRKIAEPEVQKFLDDLKLIKKTEKQSPQSYRLFYPKIISGAELHTDENSTKVVHLEAYPR